MTFVDAIPVKSTSESGFGFKGSMHRNPAKPRASGAGRQSVNVSRETMVRVAREKLLRAVTSKISYNRFGEFDQAPQTGTLLNVKA